MNSKLKTSFASVIALSLFGVAVPALAQNHSWRWPLYVRVEDANGVVTTGQPRPAAWNSAGEYQNYGPDNLYLHPGHDLRGNVGDPALIPTDSTLERVFLDHTSCEPQPDNGWTGSSCRLWFRAKEQNGRYLYYVSHVDFSKSAMAPGRHVATEIRQQVQDVEAATRAGTTLPESQRSVNAGQMLSTLAEFGEEWHHLHVGIFDTQSQYRMQNTITFFEQAPAGQNGESLVIVDDEPPVVADIALHADQSSTDALESGVCGAEVRRAVDIKSNIFDTFYTTGNFADFPRKNDLNPNTGIRKADYTIRRVADGSIRKSGTWFDIAATPILCTPGTTTGRGCLLATDPSPTISGFLDRMGLEEGAPSPGLTVIEQLFDIGGSVSDYSASGNEKYIHILTNENGVNGFWDAAAEDNGRYEITVRAEDFSGRTAARSMFVTVHQPNTTLDTNAPGMGDAYVRDRQGDVGAIPSNAGGEPFWESPDIFVVPLGTQVDVNGAAVQSQVTANSEYHVYVRVNNDGCREISGLRAQVRSANPSAIVTDWKPIVTYDQNATTWSVAPGQKQLLGPFYWKPTPEEAAMDGHRCLLAAVSSDQDRAPEGNLEFDAPASNNVAQRNLRVTGCLFQLPNPTSANGTVDLRIVTDAPVESANNQVALVLPHIPAWYAAWQGNPQFTVTSDGTTMRVQLHVRDVTLPTVTLLSGAVLDLTFDLQLSTTTARKVSLEPRFNNMAQSGFTCFGSGNEVPK
jgi:hypothetical protein